MVRTNKRDGMTEEEKTEGVTQPGPNEQVFRGLRFCSCARSYRQGRKTVSLRGIPAHTLDDVMNVVIKRYSAVVYLRCGAIVEAVSR